MFGSNANGRLGIGAADTVQHSTPVKVDFFDDKPISWLSATDYSLVVTTGDLHNSTVMIVTHLVSADGSLYGFGDNNNQQMYSSGDGTVDASGDGIMLLPVSNVSQASAGFNHAVILTHGKDTHELQ